MNRIISQRAIRLRYILRYLLIAGVLLVPPLTESGAQEADRQQQTDSQDDTQEIDESELLWNGEPGEDGAEAEAGAEDEPDRLNTFTVWDFLRMILILGAVIGLIYLIFWFIKKKGSPSLQNNELFSILSTQAVASNRAIHLVQVGNQYFLVGSGENSVNLISEIGDKETVDEIRMKMSQQEPGNKKSFRDMLSGMFGQSSSVRLDGGVSVKTDFLKNQRDRLKRM
ncbi:MAG: flagellar biosynthetic protein FliO [Spirochaetota bacterium]